jgi:transcriptional regulator with XRE-family HTH domain
MPQPRELDPAASVGAFFGAELRRYREAADLSQERLGEIIGYSGRLVGLVETARRTPSRDLAERCDAALGTDGTLARLWPLLNRDRFPSWFRGYAELEAIATEIRHYEGPPLLWVVLDEAVLRRRIGGAKVMYAQLAYLIEAAVSPFVVLQVLPFSAGPQAGLSGAFIVLCFDEGPPAVWSDGPASGQLIHDSGEVADCLTRYDLLRAGSMAPDASAALVKAAMEEL